MFPVAVPVPVSVPVPVPVSVARRWQKSMPNEWKQNEAIKQRHKRYENYAPKTHVKYPKRDIVMNSLLKIVKKYLMNIGKLVIKVYNAHLFFPMLMLRKRKLQRIRKVIPDEIARGVSTSRKMGCLSRFAKTCSLTLSISNSKVNPVMKAGNENVGITFCMESHQQNFEITRTLLSERFTKKYPNSGIKTMT